MIMCTLLSMIYGLFKPYSFTHVTGTCLKETALFFNVHLSFFVDFILCPADMFKVNSKKIRFICMCSRLKINTACHCSFVFIVDFDHSQHINIVFVLLTLKKYFTDKYFFKVKDKVIMFWRVWKTSHNVLKSLFQGLFHSAIYRCTQLKQIATILSAYYDITYYGHMFQL